MSDQDRIAVVTGANRGLGFATASELGRRGYHVIVTARRAGNARDAAVALGGEGTFYPAELDVSSDESVDALFDRLDREHGRIDVLVNNAGTMFEPRGASVADIPASLLARAFDNNTLSAYRMCQKAVPRMNRAGFGRIVNVSSGMGGLTEMGAGHPAYRASKAALNVVTRVFAHEVEGDVKINSVCPGWVRTDMGGPNATRSIDEGIRGIVWAATLPPDGPSGGFFRDAEAIAW